MSTLFQRRYQENTRLQSVCKMIVNIIMVIVSAYVIVTFMCDRTIISGGSMQPVIENEDTVLINRFAYSFTKPKRYSVAAFKSVSYTQYLQPDLQPMRSHWEKMSIFCLEITEITVKTADLQGSE